MSSRLLVSHARRGTSGHRRRRACRFPGRLRHTLPVEDQLTPAALLDGRPNTLYLVAWERHKRLLTPLVVSIVAEVLHHAAELGNAGRPLEPTLRVLVDEAANVAPLRDLPGHLSQAAAHGVRFATVWQSLAQMRERYREGADSILANSTAKLFMGPSRRDHRPLHHWAARRRVRHTASRTVRRGGGEASITVGSTKRAKASAAALQQLGGDRAMVVEGHHSPAVVALRPYWKDWRASNSETAAPATESLDKRSSSDARGSNDAICADDQA